MCDFCVKFIHLCQSFADWHVKKVEVVLAVLAHFRLFAVLLFWDRNDDQLTVLLLETGISIGFHRSKFGSHFFGITTEIRF